MADLRTLARSITPKRADSFLQAVLNLDLSDEKTALHFLEKFKEFLPRLDFKLGIGPVLIGQGHKLDPLKEVRRVLRNGVAASNRPVTSALHFAALGNLRQSQRL